MTKTETSRKALSPAAAAVGDVLLSNREVAEVLGFTPNSIRVHLHRGTFPLRPIKIGGRLRWRASDVRRFLDEATAR